MLSDDDLLEKLVGFDTTSSNPTGPITDFVCNYLSRRGVTVERCESADGEKTNVVAWAGDLERYEEGLMLCGHLDVVPATEPQWETNPFELTEHRDTFIARGSCDMKASIALMMNLLGEVDVRRIQAPLAVLFTYDEEVGSLGAQRFAETWPADRTLPRSVIVGEPTSLRAVRLHKGHLTIRITVAGRAAHSGQPQMGTNAIEPAAKIVTALQRLGETMKRQRLDNSQHFPSVPYVVINVAHIEGGGTLNIVPDECVIDIGVRLLPGMSPQNTIEQVRDAALKASPSVANELEVLNNNPPMLLDEKARINKRLCQDIGQFQTIGVSFCSDAGVLAEQGHECMLYGPGSIEVAHRPNEYLPVPEFREARKTLQRQIEKFCMTEW